MTQSSVSCSGPINQPGWAGSYYQGSGPLFTGGFVTAANTDGYGLPLPGGTPCFAAGTQVLVGYDSNGNAITRNIEEIQVGDTVLAREQSGPRKGVKAYCCCSVCRAW